MKEAGSGMMALGGVAIFVGLLISVGRSTGFGEVANLHAMHVQGLIIQGGFFAFLSGAVLFAGGTINETLKTKSDDTAHAVGQPAIQQEFADADEAPAAQKEWWRTDFVIGLGILLAVLAVIAIIGFSVRPRSPAYSEDPAIEAVANISEMDLNMEPPAQLNAPLPY